MSKRNYPNPLWNPWITLSFLSLVFNGMYFKGLILLSRSLSKSLAQKTLPNLLFFFLFQQHCPSLLYLLLPLFIHSTSRPTGLLVKLKHISILELSNFSMPTQIWLKCSLSLSPNIHVFVLPFFPPYCWFLSKNISSMMTGIFACNTGINQ